MVGPPANRLDSDLFQESIALLSARHDVSVRLLRRQRCLVLAGNCRARGKSEREEGLGRMAVESAPCQLSRRQVSEEAWGVLWNRQQAPEPGRPRSWACRI